MQKNLILTLTMMIFSILLIQLKKMTIKYLQLKKMHLISLEKNSLNLNKMSKIRLLVILIYKSITKMLKLIITCSQNMNNL